MPRTLRAARSCAQASSHCYYSALPAGAPLPTLSDAARDDGPPQLVSVFTFDRDCWSSPCRGASRRAVVRCHCRARRLRRHRLAHMLRIQRSLGVWPFDEDAQAEREPLEARGREAPAALPGSTSTTCWTRRSTDEGALRDELAALKVATAGSWIFDHGSAGHDDRAVALALMAVGALESRPSKVAIHCGACGQTSHDSELDWPALYPKSVVVGARRPAPGRRPLRGPRRHRRAPSRGRMPVGSPLNTRSPFTGRAWWGLLRLAPGSGTRRFPRGGQTVAPEGR
jgi:hypothetical protein